MRIAIINGPNLNLLGTREPAVYGHESFDEFIPKLRKKFSSAQIEYYQTNIEGELVSLIQHCSRFDGIVLNPAAYTHTSIAIGDAIAAIKVPVVEVHISNIFAREEFRKHSYVSSVCKGVISGLSLQGYYLAIEYLIAHFQQQ